MFSSTLITALSLFTLATAADHQIVVGGTAGKVYTPSTVDAAIGDTVSFIFESLNHTVTQSGFAVPCGLLKNATSGAVGFDSGYVPVAVGATSSPVWTLKVTVATPIWFYCKQATHCSAAGMVGGINIPTSGNKTFAAFKALAMSQTPPAAGSSGGSSGVGAAATGGLSSTSVSAAAATGTSGAGYGSYGGSSDGGIVASSSSSASGSSATVVTSSGTKTQFSALLVVVGLIAIIV